MSCHIQAKNMNFLWDRMTDSNPLQEANSIKSLSPKGAGLLKLCQSSFANLQLTFVFLSLVDVPSAFQFTPLLTSIDYQVQNMTSSPWKSVCGTISLQETNWSLYRHRSVQTNQWQLDDEWKTLRSIRKVYLSNTGEKCKNMKGAREGGRSSEIRRLTWVYFYVHVQIIFMIHGKILRFTLRILTHWPENACLYIQIKGDFPLTPPGLPHAMMCRWLQPDVHWLDTGIVLIEKTHLFTWPFLFFLFASIIILYTTMLFTITHSKFFSFRKFDGDRVLLLFFLNSAWLYNFGKGDGWRKVERENHVRALFAWKIK